MTGKSILCVDFDGVIHSYKSGWKGPRCIPDPPVDGALAFLVEAAKHFQVCIYSSRSRYFLGKWAMKQWLLRHLTDYVWDKYPEMLDSFSILDAEEDARTAAKSFIRQWKFPTRKPAAFLQIDDRAVCFTGTFPTVEEMKAFKPWNRGEV